MDRGDAHPVLAASLLEQVGTDVGVADLAVCGPPERADSVVIPPPQREWWAGLLRAPRGTRHRARAEAGGAAPVRRVARTVQARRPARSISSHGEDEAERRC